MSVQIMAQDRPSRLGLLDTAAELRLLIFTKYFEDATPEVTFCTRENHVPQVKGINLNLERTCKTVLHESRLARRTLSNTSVFFDVLEDRVEFQGFEETFKLPWFQSLIQNPTDLTFAIRRSYSWSSMFDHIADRFLKISTICIIDHQNFDNPPREELMDQILEPDRTVQTILHVAINDPEISKTTADILTTLSNSIGRACSRVSFTKAQTWWINRVDGEYIPVRESLPKGVLELRLTEAGEM